MSFDDRLYNSTADGILAVIKEADHDVSTLLVIGHNPGLHETALRLIASGDVETRERLNEGMPTSGLAVIDFAAGQLVETASSQRAAGPLHHTPFAGGNRSGVNRSLREGCTVINASAAALYRFTAAARACHDG